MAERFIPFYSWLGAWVGGYIVYWLIRRKWDLRQRDGLISEIRRSMTHKDD